MNTHYEEDKKGNKRLVIKPDTGFEKELLLHFSAMATVFRAPNSNELCVQEHGFEEAPDDTEHR